jgi:hypothetical protein
VTMFLLVYVDDIIIASSSSVVVDNLLQDLKNAFAPKDLGPLHYFLGIEVTHSAEGIRLNQKRYTTDILQRARVTACKPAPTLLSYRTKISAHDGVPLSPEDATRYRNIVSALQYLTLTRLDILFSVNKVCQYLHSPTSVHWTAVKRIQCFSEAHHGCIIPHSGISVHHD